jgi:hypothetical protein
MFRRKKLQEIEAALDGQSLRKRKTRVSFPRWHELLVEKLEYVGTSDSVQFWRTRQTILLNWYKPSHLIYWL